MLDAPVPALIFHVAPNGNDAWSGTLAAPNATQTDGPRRTLLAAREAVRAYRATHGWPTSGVTVQVQAGTYPQAESFTLTAEDSGTAAAPLSIVAAPGAKVLLSGGVAVPPTALVPRQRSGGPGAPDTGGPTGRAAGEFAGTRLQPIGAITDQISRCPAAARMVLE